MVRKESSDARCGRRGGRRWAGGVGAGRGRVGIGGWRLGHVLQLLDDLSLQGSHRGSSGRRRWAHGLPIGACRAGSQAGGLPRQQPRARSSQAGLARGLQAPLVHFLLHLRPMLLGLQPLLLRRGPAGRISLAGPITQHLPCPQGPPSTPPTENLGQGPRYRLPTAPSLRRTFHYSTRVTNTAFLVEPQQMELR